MEFIKKFLPLLIVAIVFAVGGYFIGKGNINDQGASIYKGVGSKPPVNATQYFNDDGTCWWHFDNGKPDVEGHTELMGTSGFCMPDIKAPVTNSNTGSFKANTPLQAVPTKIR
jgi:hypothetical protein